MDNVRHLARIRLTYEQLFVLMGGQVMLVLPPDTQIVSIDQDREDILWQACWLTVEGPGFPKVLPNTDICRIEPVFGRPRWVMETEILEQFPQERKRDDAT